MSKVALITQARLGSTRFKQKILHPLSQTDTVLSLHLERISLCKSIDLFYVAAVEEIGSDLIAQIAKQNNFNIFQFNGNIDDVLARFYFNSKLFEVEYIVRVTSDCPLIDPKLIDKIVQFTIFNDLDYCSNTLIDEYPDGQDIEVFKSDMLKKAHKYAKLASDREHVTPYMKRNARKIRQFSDQKLADFSEIRMTVDYPEDILVVKECLNNFGKESSWKEYAHFIRTNQNKFKNQMFIRNSGYLKSLNDD